MKVNIKNLIRPEVAKLNSYKGEEEDIQYNINLAGNESPYDLPEHVKVEITKKIMENPLNTYPNLYTRYLRCSIAEYLNIDIDCDQVIVGNGSDDVLKLLTDTFINKGDRVLAVAPTFSMYKFFSELAGAVYENLPLTENNFTFDNLKKTIDKINPKMIFLCSPNNPTGEKLSEDVILKIADIFEGVLVIDEAYAEFSDTSLISYIKEHNNLAVTRTFSKAFGLAGIRLGYLVGSNELINEVNKVLKPYNINSITSLIGRIILKQKNLIDNRVKKIVQEREKMLNILALNDNWKVYPSFANFIYIEGKEVFDFKKLLNENGIKIRTFNDPQAIRITIGKPEDNKLVARLFNDFKEGKGNG